MVGQQPWDIEIGSNNKNIGYEFSKNNRVLYVNYALGRASSIKYKKDSRVVKRVAVINHEEDGLVEIQPNLWVYYPDVVIESINWLPGPKLYAQFNKLNNRRFAKSIFKAIKRLDFKNYILFNDNDLFRPFYLKEMLKPKLSIYYSRDYLLTVDYWKKHGQDIEPKLISKSDLCVANSMYLADYCRKYNPNSFYVGQGCNVDEFVNFDGDIPADIAFLKRDKKPMIGYVGALQHIRLNIDLIKTIAIKLPDYNFVLIGSEDDEFKNSSLHNIANIYFLGHKPMDTIPAYIKAFDLCFNPQAINDITIGNYPRKIDEYLAMGKPVVATKTLAMSIFKNHVYLCRNAIEYIESIQKALQTNSTELKEKRIEFASDHTWENSVKKIYSAINKTIGIEKSTVKPIFIFSNMRYNSPIEATSLFLARALAKNYKVFYIENPSTVRDYFRHKNTDEFLTLQKSFKNSDDAVIDTAQINLKKVILPILNSINFLPEGVIYRLLLTFNERKIINRLKRVIKNEEIKNFIFINSFNFHYPDVGKLLKPALMIYHCIDPLITPYDLKHGFVSELKLVKNSDAVICTSKALYLEKKQVNDHSYLLPNAADLSHSSKALDPSLPVHPKLADIPTPIIGYFGSIERRIDYDLMQKVINKNPDKSFVFAGPVISEHTPAWLHQTTNVFLTGQIPYNEMPQMIKGFAVAIIPFKKDEVSATIFPLKLFEYLGAGKPVIITNFNPDLSDYTKETVIFCSDAEAFSNAINDELNSDTEQKLNERMKVANENTWEASANRLMDIIGTELKLKYKI